MTFQIPPQRQLRLFNPNGFGDLFAEAKQQRARRVGWLRDTYQSLPTFQGCSARGCQRQGYQLHHASYVRYDRPIEEIIMEGDELLLLILLLIPLCPAHHQEAEHIIQVLRDHGHMNRAEATLAYLAQGEHCAEVIDAIVDYRSPDWFDEAA
jgi:hypothetical protein